MRQGKSAGQATLEMTLALIATMMLLVGMGRVFIWFSDCIVARHHNPGAQYPPLHLVPQYLFGEDIKTQ